MATTKQRRLTDEERDRRRSEDRETARQAVDGAAARSGRGPGWRLKTGHRPGGLPTEEPP